MCIRDSYTSDIREILAYNRTQHKDIMSELNVQLDVYKRQNQYQQKNAAKDQEKEDTRFADSVREKSEASWSIVGNSKIGSVSAKDMTMVEYKQYIYSKISQIPMHPTRAGESISVTISEAGFEAMKNDPCLLYTSRCV